MLYFPLSWVRRIQYFSLTSLIADAFILLGLGYIFYYDIVKILTSGPAVDWVSWVFSHKIQLQMQVYINTESFPIFIGTALFSFEGICLILPIAESMKKPEKFGQVLSVTILVCGALFCAVGMFGICHIPPVLPHICTPLGYLALGSQVSTIVFLDLPGSPTVALVQFGYVLAIMLSFPLTLYPAIRITETIIFVRALTLFSNPVSYAPGNRTDGQDLKSDQVAKECIQGRVCRTARCPVARWSG